MTGMRRESALRISFLRRARLRERQPVGDGLGHDVGRPARGSGRRPRGAARRRRRSPDAGSAPGCGGGGYSRARPAAGRDPHRPRPAREPGCSRVPAGRAPRSRRDSAAGRRGRRRRRRRRGRGGDQDLVRAIADAGLARRERVRERSGLVDAGAWIAGEARPSAVGAVVARLERASRRGSAERRLDLDVRLLEEAAHAARETFAAAEHDGVGAELGADLRQQLLEGAAAEGLGVVLEGRVHVQFFNRH